MKLALVSTEIQQSKSVRAGKALFDSIKNSEIVYGLPIEIAISTALIKRLKKKKEQTGLESTYGVRGFVHYGAPLKIGIDISKDILDRIKYLFSRLRYLGTSDSLVTCTEVREEPLQRAVRPSCEPIGDPTKKNSLLVLLKDFNSSATFESVSPDRKGKPFRDVYYNFPIQEFKIIENGFKYVFDER
ncbi:MAG: hypothetical protein QXH42_09615 [Thermoplasmata archaeon]